MKKKYAVTIIISIFIAISALFASRSIAETGLSPTLQYLIDAAGKDEAIKVWIYFRDKDESGENFQKAVTRFTSRALERRASIPVDWYDLPLKADYIEAVKATGTDYLRVSRWLNAVSVRLTGDQITALAANDFVTRIEPVLILKRGPIPDFPAEKTMPTIDSAAYGMSFEQNHMLGVDSLHNLGLNGSGVLLAFLDTGYLTTHFAFDSLNIMATWNFIDNTDYVADPANEQTDHGTATLSACGGFDSGQLIGPAYKADYILAETEYKLQEIQIEEDYWVEAAEWADSLGADIISSSLGYNDWYTYSAMDGNTAVTTIAADIAASRGILVVTSAGNEGNDDWHYITAPADADSIIAVGAVNLYGTITSFSSYGPTYDGRLKPEMVALGSGVRCASDGGGYTYKDGTSLSAPLISGAAALVLEANPSLRGNPMAIRQRLIESADRLGHPDNRYGYGLPDAVLAAGFGLRILPLSMIDVHNGEDTVIAISTLAPIGEVVAFDLLDMPDGAQFTDNGDGTATLFYSGIPSLGGLRQYRIAATAGDFADTLQLTINTIVATEPITVGPNPCSDSLRIYINQYYPDGYKIEIFALSGEMVYRTFGRESVVRWPVINQAGEKVASGVYIIRFSADGIERKVKILKI